MIQQSYCTSARSLWYGCNAALTRTTCHNCECAVLGEVVMPIAVDGDRRCLWRTPTSPRPSRAS